jgi:hypothetical protein
MMAASSSLPQCGPRRAALLRDYLRHGSWPTYCRDRLVEERRFKVCVDVEERPFRAASQVRERGTESRREGRNAA